MPRTHSQDRLEKEPDYVSNEPVVITGVPPWIATLLTSAGLIVAAVLLSLAFGSREDGGVQVGPEPTITIGLPPAQGGAAVPPEPPPAGQPAPAPAGTLVAGDVPILPVPPEGLAPYQDRTVRGDGVPVYSVVADEGFWVGTSEVDRVYVVYQTGGFESPPDIDAGQLVSFIGRLEPATGELAPIFRVTEAEGLGHLRAQGYYVSVASVDILQP